jgi:hypothetical protein
MTVGRRNYTASDLLKKVSGYKDDFWITSSLNEQIQIKTDDQIDAIK